jgi:hypothetical protein
MGAEISVLNRLAEAQAVEETCLNVKASSPETPGSETELGKSEILVGEVREAAKMTAMAGSRKRKSVWDEGVRARADWLHVFVSSFMFPLRVHS